VILCQLLAKAAQEILERLKGSFDEQLITEVLPFAEFRQSDPHFHNYYRSDPKRPFCQRHIDSKLVLVRQEFSHRIAE